MERKIRMIYRDLIPCWYELSWQEKPPAIILRIHQDFIRENKEVFDDIPLFISLKKDFKFRSFAGNFDSDFGFEKAFRRREKKANSLNFWARFRFLEKREEKKSALIAMVLAEIVFSRMMNVFFAEEQAKNPFTTGGLLMPFQPA